MTEAEKIKDLLEEDRHNKIMEALNKLIALQQQMVELLLNTNKK